MLTAKGPRNPEPAGGAGPTVGLDHQAEGGGAGLGKRDLSLNSQIEYCVTLGKSFNLSEPQVHTCKGIGEYQL